MREWIVKRYESLRDRENVKEGYPLLDQPLPKWKPGTVVQVHPTYFVSGEDTVGIIKSEDPDTEDHFIVEFSSPRLYLTLEGVVEKHTQLRIFGYNLKGISGKEKK